MVYGLFMLLAAIAALFFLFNTGQLSREKTKLVNTSDAVAYSAGVMNARTLNYEAYINRAMVANSVAIGQLVSLSSWVQYVDRMATYGEEVLTNPKYIHYYPAYLAALESGAYLQEYLNETGSLEKLAKTSDQTIIRKTLMNAQQIAYEGLIPAREVVMNEVATANYAGDGTVIAQTLPMTSPDLNSFITRYKDDKRIRFAEVVKTAYKKDSFMKERNWTLPALWFDKCYLLDWLERRGGTELIGFDEWKALDTLSEKKWHKTKWGFCALSENPVAWGTQTAADDPSTGFDPTLYGQAPAHNPGATGLAIAMSSDAWDYSGLPNFYDLSESALKDDDPRLRHAVRLLRPTDQTLTSEARSDIKNSGSGTVLGQTLNAYEAQPAGGDDFVAVSASEVFFSREGEAKDNVYGSGIGKPREIGSLFNPYWQVRLIQSDAAIQAAQALQGTQMP